jgi:hypothetical protein
VVVRFVDIGAIVEYHCLNFLFIKANEFTDFYICNQNEQPPLTLTHGRHKKPTTYDVGNSSPGLGQAQKCSEFIIQETAIQKYHLCDTRQVIICPLIYITAGFGYSFLVHGLNFLVYSGWRLVFLFLGLYQY